MSIKKEIVLRSTIVYLCTLVFTLVVIGRIVQLQFIEGDKWKQKAQSINIKNQAIEPNRGEIYDCNNKLLATSLPYYEIRLDMRSNALDVNLFNEKLDSLAMELSNLFRDKSKQAYKNELLRARNTGNRYYLLKKNVNYNQLKKLKTFPVFRLGRYKGGFIVIQDNKRIQPHEYLASRTIGYTTKSQEGNEVGIEGAYDKVLGGVQGIRVMQKLAGNVYMPISDENEIEPKDGIDVVTTIDVNLQDVATHALLRQLKRHNASSGTAILMEVKTGDIKAIANLGKTSDDYYGEVYNYAIGASAEPGSTFKLPVLMAALEDGFIELTDTFDTGDGTVQYYDKIIRDTKDGGHGKLSVQEIFEVSSNVGISMIIDQFYGRDESKFVNRLYSMRLNEPLGIEIKGEPDPFIKYPGDKYWSGITLPMMSFGYEVMMTPMQILTFYNAVANEGKMVKPRFVKELRQHGKTIERYKTEVLSPSICSRSTIKRAQQMLEGVVERGTATNLKNSNYKIAGKTGTAQIANKKFGYIHKSQRLYQASFVGYFPVDKPKYSCIVVVNSPSNSVYYGNVVAGPVFKEIADKVYATSLQMHEEFMLAENERFYDPPYSKSGDLNELKQVMDFVNYKLEPNGEVKNWVRTTRQDSSILVSDYTVIENLVPNVKGMAAKDAVYLLENAGLDVVVRGRGSVRSQSLEPGARIYNGQKIVLEMSFI